jgi:hypothetical protein
MTEIAHFEMDIRRASLGVRRQSVLIRGASVAMVRQRKSGSYALAGPALALLFVIPLGLGCDNGLPRPKYVQQTTAALLLVGYPPPPARVEFIPRRPPGESVWLDGEWAWSGSKWAWTPGRWVIAPVGASFSPWTTVRDDAGNVYYASGSWRDVSGRVLSPPLALASGSSMAGDVTSSEGDDQKTATPPVASASTADAASPLPTAQPEGGAAN